MWIKKKVCIFVVAFIAMVGLLVARGAKSTLLQTKDERLVLRYGENQPKNYPTTQGAYEFASIIERETKGRIKIDIFCDSELGDEKAVIDQLQFGGIDFTRASISSLSEQSKALNVLQLPYLYTDAEQMWKVLDGEIGEELLESLKELGLIGLSWFDAGVRNFYFTKSTISSFEDLQGLNIRVQESQQMMDMIQALGAHPIPLVYSVVYSALQTGSVDGAENNWPSYEAMQHYEVAKYYVLDGHTRVPELQLVSEMTWNSFSDTDQTIVRQAAQEAARLERRLWHEREKTSEEKVCASGVTVVTLPAQEIQKFRSAMAPLYKKYGAGFEDLIAKIQATH